MRASLPNSSDRIQEQLASGAQLHSIGGARLKHKQSSFFSVTNCQQWLAIARVNVYWVRPCFGKTSLNTVPDECQLLLWQDTQRLFHVAIPLCDGDYRAVLCGSDSAPNTASITAQQSGSAHKTGLSIKWDNGLKTDSHTSVRVLYTRSGKRAHALIKAAMQEVSEILGSFHTREEKAIPDFVDYLGWCTWDAFYQDVDHKKVRAGLKSFKDGGVQLGHMILDDGMLSHREEMLSSFVADKKKFPKGLKAVADMAKDEFKLHSFGVWHAFQGYWRGVDPKSELGKQYKTFANRGKIRPWEGADQVADLRMIDPDDIHRFYFDFYRYLKSQNVDMTKVDNQSALERYSHLKRSRGQSMRAYQEAFQGAGQHFFNGNILHCMSSGSDVGLNMMSSNAYRNSDDYFPKKNIAAQQMHVSINAFNATLSSHFSIPDWDMFQTHSPCAEFHAAARAISGGPIYVCDYPKKQNFKLLKKIALADGRVLRCEQPALVCEDSLFTDVGAEDKALKIYNHHQDVLILGLFHCKHSEEAISCSFQVKDHPDALNGANYACYRHEAKTLSVQRAKDQQLCDLAAAAFELVWCSPIVDGVAPLGLLDQYNGCAAIDVHGWCDEGYICHLVAGSAKIGFYCDKKPKAVIVNERAVSFSYHNKLLSVKSSGKKTAEVLITF